MLSLVAGGDWLLAWGVSMWHIASFTFSSRISPYFGPRRRLDTNMHENTKSMEIWPAIDLRGGRCVRLIQGDYQQETIYGDDPAAMARQWVEQGAERLHLVDLDGARDGRMGNADAIRAIRKQVDVPCQLGGGIRDEAVIQDLLDWGIDRLVVGTKALREPEWFQATCERFPQRLVAGIDARNGLVATDGWLETSDVPATELAARLALSPVAGIVYTDIAKDGMLAGPNLDAMRQMQQAVSVPVIASGGVTTAEDVRQLAAIPMAGAIIGRTLYEGRLTLHEALEAALEVG